MKLNGILKYGPPDKTVRKGKNVAGAKWATILSENEYLQKRERTNVNLKDKWRSLQVQ